VGESENRVSLRPRVDPYGILVEVAVSSRSLLCGGSSSQRCSRGVRRPSYRFSVESGDVPGDSPSNVRPVTANTKFIGGLGACESCEALSAADREWIHMVSRYRRYSVFALLPADVCFAFG